MTTTSYFVLRPCYVDGQARITTEPELPFGYDVWGTGARIGCPLKLPLRYEIEPEDSGEMPSFFRTAAPLMSRRLIHALRDAGADNLECFGAVVMDVATGHAYDDYEAVNTLGLVDGIDAAASGLQSIEGLVHVFSRLVLRPEAIRGLTLFRLRRHPMEIIVSDAVRASVLAHDVPLMEFIPVEEYT